MTGLVSLVVSSLVGGLFNEVAVHLTPQHAVVEAVVNPLLYPADIVALKLPADAGAKVTTREQLEPATSEVEHVPPVPG